jgi:aminoglycoside phosphotransferase (APT) family kinase protein
MIPSSTQATGRPIGPLPAERTLRLSALLDGAAMKGLLRGAMVRPEAEITGCHAEHIRYEPGSSCVISYAVEYGLADRTRLFKARLYARAFDRDGYVRAVAALTDRTWARGALLGEPLPLPLHQAILYEFPNDARLVHLAAFAQPATLMGVMQRVAATARPGFTVSQHRLDLRLLRYKPESRCVLFCAVDCDPRGDAPAGSLAAVLRTAKPGKVEASFQALTLLYDLLRRNAPVSIPRPLFCDPALQLMAVEWVEGEKLSDLWTKPEGDQAILRTGRALAWLHRVQLPKTDGPEPSTKDRRIEGALALLEGSTSAVAEQIGQLRERFRLAAARGASSQRGWIHGDFHQGQVLCRPADICFLDFDGATVGEIEQDLGNFLAQVAWLNLQGRLPGADAIAASFLEAYREEAGIAPDLHRIRYWCAAALTELAAKQYRRLKAEWPNTVPLLLAAAETELGDR